MGGRGWALGALIRLKGIYFIVKSKQRSAQHQIIAWKSDQLTSPVLVGPFGNFLAFCDPEPWGHGVTPV